MPFHIFLTIGQGLLSYSIEGFSSGGFVTEICVRADYVHGGLCLVLEHPRLHRVSCVIARDFNSLSVRLYGVMICGP